MELHLRIIGALLIALSLLHIIFPTYFNWKTELKNLSLINRQVMYVHTLFIALTLFLMGILCLTSASELIETKLGHTVALGFCVFWIARLVVQFIGYSPKLWKGKTLETAIHIIFSVLWAYTSIVFFLVYLQTPHLVIRS